MKHIDISPSKSYFKNNETKRRKFEFQVIFENTTSVVGNDQGGRLVDSVEDMMSLTLVMLVVVVAFASIVAFPVVVAALVVHLGSWHK